MNIAALKRYRWPIGITAVILYIGLCVLSADLVPTTGLWSWLPGAFVAGCLLVAYFTFFTIYWIRHPQERAKEFSKESLLELLQSLGWLAVAGAFSAGLVWLVSQYT